MNTDTKYMTTKELADELEVTPRTVQNWVKSGIVTKFVRIGPRRIRFVIPDALDEIRRPNVPNSEQ